MLGGFVTGPSPGGAGSLWGRTDELERIGRVIQDADGPMRGVLVAGEAGIGKSSLWKVGLDIARRTAIRALVTTSVEAEGEMPYAGLENLVSDLFDDYRSALPGPQRDALDAAFLRRGSEGVADPRTVAAGTATLLDRASAEGPVVLAVDDVQWLDSDTDVCLAYALRRLADRRLLLLLTIREPSPLWTPPRGSEPGSVLAALATHLTELRLEPLSAGAIRAMLGDRLDVALSADDSDHIALETGGNPFWALQFGHALRLAGDRGNARAMRPPAPDALVAERIADLDEAVVDVSCLVAALGRPRTAIVVRAIADLHHRGAGPGEPDVEGTLDRAVAAGLLAEADGRMAPSHPLIGAALLAALPPFRRRRLHRSAAEFAGSAEARALLLLQATTGAGGDRDDHEESVVRPTEWRTLLTALDEAVLAARHRGAAGSAARFAVRALGVAEHLARPGAPPAASEASEEGEDELRQRRVLLAELHYQAGERAPVLSVLEQVDPAALDAELLERAAPLLVQTLHEQRGGPAARAAVESLRHITPREASPAALARHEALIATLSADRQCGALGDRRPVAHRAVAWTEAAPVGVPVRRRALEALAFALLDAGEPADEVVDQLRACGPGEGPELTGWVDIDCVDGMSRRLLFDFDGARESFATAFEHHLITGDAPRITHAGSLLAYTAVQAGVPAAAAATLRRLEDHVDRRSLRWPYVVLARGDLHLVRGEHESVDELLEQVGRDGDRSEFGGAVAARLRGLLARQREDPERAAGLFDQFAEICDRVGVPDPRRRLEVDVPRAETMIALGEYGRAGSIADELGALADRTGHAILRGQQRGVLAQLACARDDLDGALALGREAVELLEGCPIPLEYGRSLAVLADVEERRGDPAAAAGYRSRAHEHFVAIGYRWWASRTVDPTPTGRLTLSPGEQTVVDLVARGATNRETATALHLSVRTVENHLHHVYRKLGIRSRAELASASRESGSAEPGTG